MDKLVIFKSTENPTKYFKLRYTEKEQKFLETPQKKITRHQFKQIEKHEIQEIKDILRPNFQEMNYRLQK